MRLTWPQLYRQFGADPARAGDKNTVNAFRTDCLRELKKITSAWPGPALPDGPGGAADLALAASHPARATAPRGIAWCRVSAMARMATDIHPYAVRTEVVKSPDSVDPRSFPPEPSQSPNALRCFQRQYARDGDRFAFITWPVNGYRHQLSGNPYSHHRRHTGHLKASK